MHPLGFTHGQRLREHYFNNLLGNPIESTIAVAHLIFDGVLDQLPLLKLCIAHGGGYLPMYTGRMDHAFRARADCRQHIQKPPSEYLKRLFFDTLPPSPTCCSMRSDNSPSQPCRKVARPWAQVCPIWRGLSFS